MSPSVSQALFIRQVGKDNAGQFPQFFADEWDSLRSCLAVSVSIHFRPLFFLKLLEALPMALGLSWQFLPMTPDQIHHGNTDFIARHVPCQRIGVGGLWGRKFQFERGVGEKSFSSCAFPLHFFVHAGGNPPPPVYATPPNLSNPLGTHEKSEF